MSNKAKYWIYHIPGVKIGVSNQPEHRIIKQQGFTEYEILEEHTNIKEVSKREIELQKQYGYRVDNVEYWKVRRMQKKAITKEANKKRVANTDFTARAIDYKAIFEKRDNKAIQAKRVPKMYKPVNQYDLEGNFIKQWESQKHAIKELNLTDKNGISACCKGNQKTSHKFIWKYA